MTSIVLAEMRAGSRIAPAPATSSPARAAVDAVLHFEQGLLGFGAHRRWVLLDGPREGTAWMTSVDHANITFLLVDPFVQFDGYAIDLSPADLRRVGATHATDVLVYALVTLPRERDDDATANLQGPLVINLAARRGMQVVLESGQWGVREPFATSALRAQS
jgi:flagellar assembly factor FliW